MNEEAAGFNFGTSTNGFGMSDLLPNLSNANQQLEGQGLNSVFPPFQGTPQRAVTQYMGNSSPYDFHMGHDHTPTTSQKRARVDRLSIPTLPAKGKLGRNAVIRVKSRVCIPNLLFTT